MRVIRSISDISDAYDNGGSHVQPFIKVWPSTFSTAGGWYDGTMAGNYPKASYYTTGDDLAFTLYPTGTHLSHFHFGNVSPKQKIIRSICMHGSAAGVQPAHFILCDYIGFVGGISLETDAAQTFNTDVAFPRYTNGDGVQAALIQLFGSNLNSIGTLSYYNQAGVLKTSQTIVGNTLGTGSTQNGSLAGTYVPFIQLGAGDVGIRSVVDITFSTPGTGIAVLILVKPLCEIITRDTTFIAPYERDFATDMNKLPIVPDGACLNFLMSPSATAASLLTRGYIEFAWA